MSLCLTPRKHLLNLLSHLPWWWYSLHGVSPPFWASWTLIISSGGILRHICFYRKPETSPWDFSGLHYMEWCAGITHTWIVLDIGRELTQDSFLFAFFPIFRMLIWYKNFVQVNFCPGKFLSKCLVQMSCPGHLQCIYACRNDEDKKTISNVNVQDIFNIISFSSGVALVGYPYPLPYHLWWNFSGMLMFSIEMFIVMVMSGDIYNILFSCEIIKIATNPSNIGCVP